MALRFFKTTCCFSDNDKPCHVTERQCQSGLCIASKHWCLYDLDQFGYRVGCRDGSHLRDCGVCKHLFDFCISLLVFQTSYICVQYRTQYLYIATFVLLIRIQAQTQMSRISQKYMTKYYYCKMKMAMMTTYILNKGNSITTPLFMV